MPKNKGKVSPSTLHTAKKPCRMGFRFAHTTPATTFVS